ncbi:unnamed protein product [Ectocarpus sp. 4 AP-2014]|uniref:EsV-1-148 n=1 Tax=Ectocarpus siliculosus virus 1 (isolate New Zealand/Kaikoura/1988) TaxID=654926 RepID=Q8QND4_ESV1K|nr:EsV-1-148 [Ectocarpus siliculosus virus 1]AAK14563.1 EsV-1-148 [Ectocarpus siliculosus virus 1]
MFILGPRVSMNRRLKKQQELRIASDDDALERECRHLNRTYHKECNTLKEEVARLRIRTEGVNDYVRHLLHLAATGATLPASDENIEMFEALITPLRECVRLRTKFFTKCILMRSVAYASGGHYVMTNDDVSHEHIRNELNKVYIAYRGVVRKLKKELLEARQVINLAKQAETEAIATEREAGGGREEEEEEDEDADADDDSDEEEEQKQNEHKKENDDEEEAQTQNEHKQGDGVSTSGDNVHRNAPKKKKQGKKGRGRKKNRGGQRVARKLADAEKLMGDTYNSLDDSIIKRIDTIVADVESIDPLFHGEVRYGHEDEKVVVTVAYDRMHFSIGEIERIIESSGLLTTVFTVFLQAAWATHNWQEELGLRKEDVISALEMLSEHKHLFELLCLPLHEAELYAYLLSSPTEEDTRTLSEIASMDPTVVSILFKQYESHRIGRVSCEIPFLLNKKSEVDMGIRLKPMLLKILKDFYLQLYEHRHKKKKNIGSYLARLVDVAKQNVFADPNCEEIKFYVSEYSRVAECILSDNSRMVVAFYRDHETDEGSLQNVTGLNMYSCIWHNLKCVFTTKNNVVTLQKNNERVNLLGSMARGRLMTILFHFKPRALYYRK